MHSADAGLYGAGPRGASSLGRWGLSQASRRSTEPLRLHLPPVVEGCWSRLVLLTRVSAAIFIPVPECQLLEAPSSWLLRLVLGPEVLLGARALVLCW